MSTQQSQELDHLDVGDVTGVPADDREKVVGYFAQFADTRTDDGEVKCPGCEGVLYGSKGPIWQAMGLYTFTWGIAHGEGQCSGCGWPACGYPAVELSDGKKMSFPIPLPYHPDVVVASTSREPSDG